MSKHNRSLTEVQIKSLKGRMCKVEDAIAATVTPNAFENGLTEAGNVVKLGGDLTGQTVIDGVTNSFGLTLQDLLSLRVLGATTIDLISDNTTLEGSTKMYIKPPNHNAVGVFNGFSIKLKDKATGEVEWGFTSGQSLYDANVSTNPAVGDFTSIGDAITAGAKTIWVQEGIYNETGSLTLVEGAVIVGEGPGTIINLPAGAQINAIAPGGGNKTGGTIDVTNNSNLIDGAGTNFVAGDVGSWIRIDDEFFKVTAVNSTIQLEVDRPYKGTTTTGLTYRMRKMLTGIQLRNLHITGGGVATNLINWVGVLYGTMEKLFVEDCTNYCITLSQCGISTFDKVIAKTANRGISVSASSGIKMSNIDASNTVNGVVIGTGSSGCSISKSFADGNTTRGVWVSTSSSDINVSDVKANNNNGRGIHVEDTCINVTVDNCRAVNNPTDNISGGGTNVVFSNCTVIGSGGMSTGSGGKVIGCDSFDGSILATDSDCLIMGNTVTNGGIAVTSGVQKDNIKIIGNTVIDPPFDGIYSLTTSNNNVVVNNTVSGVAAPYHAISGGTGADWIVNSNQLFNNASEYQLGGISNVEFNSRILNQVSTVNTTAPTILATIPLFVPSGANHREYSFNIHIGAMGITGTVYGTWVRTLVARKNSGVTTIQVFNPDLDNQTGLVPGDVTASVNGSNEIEIIVTGTATEDISWSSTHKLVNTLQQ